MATVTHYIAIMKWVFLLNRAACTLKIKRVSQTIYKIKHTPYANILNRKSVRDSVTSHMTPQLFNTCKQ